MATQVFSHAGWERAPFCPVQGRHGGHQGQASSEHKSSHQFWHAHLILTRLHRLCWCGLFSGIFSCTL